MKPKTAVLSGIILFSLSIIGIAFAVDGWFIIDQTEVGVLKTFGKVESDPVSPGLHVKLPIIQSVYRMPVYEKTISMTQLNGNAVKALTKEGLPVVIDISIQYKVNPSYAPKIYSEVRNPEQWMTPRVRAKVRNVISTYTVEDLYTDKREEVQQKIQAELSKEFDNKGIIITAALVRNIELPKQVEGAIEAKLKAKQEQEKMVFEVEKAKLEAQKKIVEANATAEANEIVAESIRKNPEILEYKKLEVLEKMSESQNKVFVVPGSNDLMLNVNNK